MATQCGDGGEEQITAAFVRLLTISPREYRRRFATSSSLDVPASTNCAGKGQLAHLVIVLVVEMIHGPSEGMGEAHGSRLTGERNGPD